MPFNSDGIKNERLHFKQLSMFYTSLVQFHGFVIFAIGAQGFSKLVSFVVHQNLQLRHADQLIANDGFVGKHAHARMFHGFLFGEPGYSRPIIVLGNLSAQKQKDR